MFDPKKIKADQHAMETARNGVEQYMRESAQLFLPRHSQFDAAAWPGHTRGPQNDIRIFDPHAQQAVEQGVALFEGYVMPRGQIWQRWQLPDEDLMKIQHVRAWVEDKNRLLFKFRNDPGSGFTGQTHESIASLLVLGMQAMWPDIRRDRQGKALGLGYKSDFVGQIYVKTDAMGLVSTVHYKFTLTAEQAQGFFGDDAPGVVKKAMRDQRGDSEFAFIHRCLPNQQFDPSKIDWRGKPWAGCYYCCEGEEVFRKGGYRAIPRIVSRYITAPNEDYGRCPAFVVTPAVKATQQMVQDLMLASEMGAMPPMGASSDMLDQTIKYAAQEVTYGAIDHRGNRRIQPLYEGADMSASFTLLERMQTLIDRAFFVDMLQIRQDMKSHVTDSQLYQREEEKGILLAPLANQQTEWFSVMLEREIDLMDEMGAFDDMPGEVAEALEAGMSLVGVEYDNGLTRAMDAGAAAGYWRMLEQFGPIFQSDEAAWGMFTEKYPLDKVLDHMGRINGVPASWEASNADRAAASKANREQMGMKELATILPSFAKSAKDLSASVPEAANG
jgi:hypothetical protein